MGILEKISEIEKEISRTQKNKGNLNATKHPVNYANCSFFSKETID